MKDSGVVVFSGGMDSTVLLKAIDLEDNVASILTFDYGQKHMKEIDSAIKVVSKLGLTDLHHIVDLTSITGLISSGALTGKVDVPHAMYDEETQKQTIVPNRNMIMLSIAAGHAISIGAKVVYYAAHAGDHEIYPDCRPSFVHSMNATLKIANEWEEIELRAPFVKMDKIAVAKFGMDIGAPLELTWSCYEGGDRPCLKCGTCLERTEAFYRSGLVDSALSEDEWEEAKKEFFKANQERHV